jgi:hypothetical protein
MELREKTMSRYQKNKKEEYELNRLSNGRWNKWS